MTEETVFTTALEKRTCAERAAFLDEACAGDAALRQRVEALLKSHVAGGDFMTTPVLKRAVEELGQRGADAPSDPARGNSGEQAMDFLASSEKPGSLGRLGHYEVLEIIGRGGMGIVLRAFDDKLHRVVAIKVMAAHLASNASARMRFMREAQAAAAVSHDHIVTIHAVEEANLPYLVMQYVAGVSLEQRLERDGPLNLHEILRIGMQTAAGLAAAHAQGLIHRDIKPANILLENGVERVKITDFGLARAVDDAHVTQVGAIAGTPHYMAPEQARGEAVDHRADLFSLGSVLYALCTGEPPFRGGGTLSVLRRVGDDVPRPIREVNPSIPEWLEALIAKLHARRPADRFQSATEVADLLRERLVQVQQGSEVRKHQRGRGRWLVVVAALVLLVVTGAAGYLFGPAVYRLATGSEVSKSEPQPAPGATPSLVEVRRFEAGVNVVHSLAFSPDGRRALAGSGMENKDGKLGPGGQYVVRLWDLEDGRELGRFEGHSNVISAVAFSLDGRRGLSSSQDGSIRCWNLETGEQLQQYTGKRNCFRSVAFSPDGSRALAGGADGCVWLWFLDNGQAPLRFEGPGGQVHSLAYARDGRRAVSGNWPNARETEDTTESYSIYRFVALDSGTEFRPSERHSGRVHCLAFSPDGRRVLAGCSDRLLRLWDLESDEPPQTLAGHSASVLAVAFSLDGQRALSGSSDRSVRLWDLTARKELARGVAHTSYVRCVAFSPDGRHALSGSHDRSLRLWRLPDD
jgi:WD40 repeat protein